MAHLFCFYLITREMKEKDLEALCANMDILNAGLDACHVFEWKDNLIDSTEWKTGETGDILK